MQATHSRLIHQTRELQNKNLTNSLLKQQNTSISRLPTRLLHKARVANIMNGGDKI